MGAFGEANMTTKLAYSKTNEIRNILDNKGPDSKGRTLFHDQGHRSWYLDVTLVLVDLRAGDGHAEVVLAQGCDLDLLHDVLVDRGGYLDLLDLGLGVGHDRGLKING